MGKKITVETELEIDVTLEFVEKGDNQNPKRKRIRACFLICARLSPSRAVTTFVFVPIPWQKGSREEAASKGSLQIISNFESVHNIVLQDPENRIFESILKEIEHKVRLWEEPRE